MEPARHTAFDTLHPAVPGVFVVTTIVLTMSAMHPVLIGCSLMGGLAYSAVARGPRATLSGLRWQAPFIVLVALVNPLFSAEGSTELLKMGSRAVYLESMAYGLCMGGLFVASVLWFEAATRLVPADVVLSLLGRVAPTVALMVSQCMRLVPRLVRQGGEISRAQDALRTPRPALARAFTKNLRLSTVLMGWALEDSLETADAMRARGWGAARTRTHYRRYRFTRRDAACLAAVALAGAAAASLVLASSRTVAFYPAFAVTTAWWGYAPYLLWMLAPALLHLREAVVFD